MDDVILSEKQKEMLNEIELCNRCGDDDELFPMKWRGSTIVPKIIDETRNCLSLNYVDYLDRCKVNVADKLRCTYNLEPFIDGLEEISNNEIILYRYKLEEILQSGLQALIQIQFLDSLVILRRLECKEKLDYHPESLENIRFLMDNLVMFHKLDLPTVTNEFYVNEKEKLTNEFTSDSSHEVINQINVKAFSIALRKQHECIIERNLKTLIAKCTPHNPL